MKKLIGLIALAGVLSAAMIGCSQPTEGDTAPATNPPATTPDTTAK